MNNNLIIFTATFPYGGKENFLETELPFLSQRFEKIRIIPFGGSAEEGRTLPMGCVLDNRLLCTRRQRILSGLWGLWRVLPLYLKDLVVNKPFKNKRAIKSWFISMLCASYYLQSKPIKELQGQILADTVLYFYWGVIYNSIAPFFKDRVKMISRFHGDWDLWVSCAEEGYKPIRKATVEALSLAVLISHKGEAFFKPKYPNCPTVVSHLGSLDNGICKKSQDGILRVASCSTVYPLKRVPLIFESLKEVAKTRRVEWVHIGGGKDFESLKNLIYSEETPNLKVVLTGSMHFVDVINYYKNHCVDLFINLSTNEGIPVSIMEAISFDIPVVATDVGGTSEIVNKETGVLVSQNPSKEEVAEAILNVINSDDFVPRSFWKREFDASKNYSDFALMLSKL